MPATMVDAEVIRNAVRLACRAPSLHNSQPWRWVLEGAALQLFADADRVVRATDSSGREALMACGAVLDHFRVAMAAAGYTANVERFPNPNNRLHVASVDFTPLEYVTDGHRQRANAILLRRTDRLPFAAPPDWDSFESALRDTVTSEAVRLDTIPDDLRPQLAEASQLTESLRLYDSSYHAELEWWTAAFEVSEGIPHSSLVSAAESDRVDVGRTFPVTHHRERRPEVDEDHAKVAVLSTYDESALSVLRCGEMLSAVLLDATMVGLATCTLTHITEMPASREIVAGLIGQSSDDITPQVLVRVGRAPSIEDVPPPTPRRPVDDVFEVRAKRPMTAATGTFASRRRAATSITSKPNDAQVHQVQEPPWKTATRPRPPSWSASMVHDPQSMPRFGPSTKQSVAISRYGSCTQSTRPDSGSAISRRLPRELAAAEVAVRYAFTAVESTDKPVKIEVEILQDRPTQRAARGLTVGRPAVRRRDGSQTLRPRQDWLNRGGVGVIRPLPPWPSSADTTRSVRNNSG